MLKHYSLTAIEREGLQTAAPLVENAICDWWVEKYRRFCSQNCQADGYDRTVGNQRGAAG